MKLEKYIKYKVSGIEWLGDIPKDWEIKRNKEIFQEISDLKSSGKETLLTVSHITGVTPRSEKNVNMFFAETMEGYKKCKKGDLIINTMWAWMGALGISKHNGICSPAYNVYRQNGKIKYEPQYFDYLFRTPNFVKEMTKNSKGIVESRLRLYPKDFNKIHTCFPPPKTQTTVANYLDKKTSAIDKKVILLEQKTKKYKELRKSIISKTVTKGLNPNVKLKDSGISWIGKIPEHWEVQRIKDNFYISRGRVIAKTELLDNGKYPVYSSQTKNDGVLGLIETYDFNADLLTWTTDGVNAGTVFRRKGKFNCTNICGTLKPIYKSKISLDFMVYAVQKSTKHNKRIDTNGAKIMSNEMAVIHIAYPEVEEQKEIAEYLNHKTSTIDKIVSNIEKQIEVLKELRKTLINDVVTGKIKVAEQ